jgi:hypothetical protein
MIGMFIDIQSLLNVAGKVQSVLPEGKNYDTLQRIVATSVLGDMKIRIHQKGLAADGGRIGSYSTKPLYVGVKANVGKSFGRPVGKTGLSKFKSGAKKGQDHASRYFPGGYGEYKSAIGRNEIGSVNLSLSGQMDKELTLIKTDKGYGLGWANADLLERAKFFEGKKYSKSIWGLTEDEKITVSEVAKNYLYDALS